MSPSRSSRATGAADRQYFEAHRAAAGETMEAGRRSDLYVYHLDRGELRKGEQTVHLTDREREICGFWPWTRRKNRAAQRADRRCTVNERAVDVQINRLRRKIERDPANPLFLAGARGIGYRLVASALSTSS